MPQYIYLIQEKIHADKNIYKIGTTKYDNMTKIYNSFSGNQILYQHACKNTSIIEEQIMSVFKKKYETQYKIGERYFKGNHMAMIDDMQMLIESTTNLTDIDCVINAECETNVRMKKIKKVFPCYNDDECFGGSKKLIKFNIDDKAIRTYHINESDDGQEYVIKEDILQRDWFKIYQDDSTDYLSKLINSKTIEDNKIYDFNDDGFINSLDMHKDKVTITYTEQDMQGMADRFKEYKRINSIEYKIDKMLCCNCILNDEIYCDSMCDVLRITFSEKEIKRMEVVEINNESYDYSFLRKYTPYFIDVGETEFYIYNIDCRIIADDGEQHTYDWDGERIYLFNDESNPIRTTHSQFVQRQLLLRLITAFNKATLDKRCMNMTENTRIILRNCI